MDVQAAPHIMFGTPAIRLRRCDARVHCTARVTIVLGGSQVFRVFKGRNYREFFFVVFVCPTTKQNCGVAGHNRGASKETSALARTQGETAMR